MKHIGSDELGIMLTLAGMTLGSLFLLVFILAYCWPYIHALFS